MMLSPERADPFAADTPANARSYKQVLEEVQVDKEHDRVMREAKIKVQEEQRKELAKREAQYHQEEEVTVKKQKQSQWDEAPAPESTRRSRWDETPLVGSHKAEVGATPQHYVGETPVLTAQSVSMTPELAVRVRWEREMDIRNAPWSVEDIDELLPSEGYSIVQPPAGYNIMATPSRSMLPPKSAPVGFHIQSDDNQTSKDKLADYNIQHLDSSSLDELPLLKPEDVEHFGVLLKQKDEGDLDRDERYRREILTLLLQIKNGEPIDRKRALRMVCNIV